MTTGRAYLVLGALLASSAARADEFEPEVGVFGGYEAPSPYHLRLRTALLGSETYRLCQLVTLPSFRAESAVYLAQSDSGGFTAVSRRIKQHLWSRMMKELAKTEKDGHYSLDAASQANALRKFETAVDTRKANLDQETGALLVDVCGKVLLRVRYPDRPTAGLDGIGYHAATWIPGTFLSGTTWSPENGTLTADFVAMEQALTAFVEADSPAVGAKAKEALIARAKRLAARLKAPSPPAKQ